MIGNGWAETVDPNTGKLYYANTETHATSWTWPEDVPKEGATDTADAAANDYVAQVDPASGKTYYVSQSKGDTTWEKPAGFVEAPAADTAAAAAAAQSRFEAKVDPASGKTFYADSVTGETTWEAPAGFDALVPTADPLLSTGDDEDDVNPLLRRPSDMTGQELSPPSPQFGAGETTPPPVPVEAPQKKVVVFGGGGDEVSDAFMRASMEALDPDDVNNFPFDAHKERKNLVSADAGCVDSAHAVLLGVVDPSETGDLQDEVEGVSFTDYADNNFNFDRKGLFSKRTTTEKLLGWKADVPKTSLSRLGDKELVGEAIQCFRNVTGFMGDRSSNKKSSDHSLKLLTICLQSTDTLRNEVYCQLVKQTTRNPSVESCVLGWQLCLTCLGSFPPGPMLRDSLMAHCTDAFNTHPAPEVQKYAELCMHAIPLICDLGNRRELPSLAELECCKRGKPLAVRVSMLDGKYCLVPCNSWTTAAQFEEVCARRLGIKDARSLSIYEVSNKGFERALDPSERILDLIAYWNRLAKEEPKAEGGGQPGARRQSGDATSSSNSSSTFNLLASGAAGSDEGVTVELERSLLYKTRLFFDMLPSDVSAIEMAYVQACHDVVGSRYPCNEQDSITLAALQVQEEFGDHPGVGQAQGAAGAGTDPNGAVGGQAAQGDEGGECKYVRGKLHKYLNARTLEVQDPGELERSVLKLYAKLHGYTQAEARLSYLDFVRAWKIYGSTYFLASPIANKLLPAEVVIAVNARGVLIVDPATKDYIEDFPYNKVVTWGHSHKTFVVVTGDVLHQRKVFFKTRQGKMLNLTMRAYVDAILEKMDDAAVLKEIALANVGGELSLDELFNLLDDNGDGELSLEEVVAAAGKLNMTSAQAKDLFSALDVLGEGVIRRAVLLDESAQLQQDEARTRVTTEV